MVRIITSNINPVFCPESEVYYSYRRLLLPGDMPFCDLGCLTVITTATIRILQVRYPSERALVESNINEHEYHHLLPANKYRPRFEVGKQRL